MSLTSNLREKHNLVSETTFRVKASAFVLKRLVEDVATKRVPKFIDNKQLGATPVISSSESELWNVDDNDSNRILTAGKVENLRIAARKLNGLEIKSGEIFSFWKHVGAPLKSRGYVIGREIREGCIVPTIGGGLCQLSNALYDAALKAGFEIIERHKHTQVIKGSLAEQDRDATVKWNYVDLRFRSANDFKIAIDLTADKLIVQFKSDKKSSENHKAGINTVPFSKLNDCYSCGNVSCFKHPGETISIEQKQATAFILDEKWPEYVRYVESIATADDHFIVPFVAGSRFSIGRYMWPVKNLRRTNTFSFHALKRAMSVRRAARSNGNIPAVYLKYDAAIVNALKYDIPIECTHVVISQNLLPFAWQAGILWGRTFDVLMTRLPIEILQQQLDNAFLKHSGSKTLKDFRADEALTDIENIALTKAHHIITPHQQIAAIFTHKAIRLNWEMQVLANKQPTGGNKILFPASALARKGAYEIKQLTMELNLELIITGSTVENKGFWDGINAVPAGADIFEGVGLVVLPSYIEHQPRLLLKALALSIPVIATTACGLGPMENLTIIPVGDYPALKKAVQQVYPLKQIQVA